MENAVKTVAGIFAGILFVASAAYAIKGGPPFPGGTNVVGTYGGVLLPSSSASPSPSPAPAPDCSANAVGVFSVGVPQSGLATGAFVMFAQGRTYTGSIQAVADPNRAKINGVLHAVLNFTVHQPDGTSIAVTATANGQLNAHIIASTSASQTTTTTSTRIRGTAPMQIDQGLVDPFTLEPIPACQAVFKVRGFKQSDTVTTTTVSGG